EAAPPVGRDAIAVGSIDAFNRTESTVDRPTDDLLDAPVLRRSRQIVARDAIQHVLTERGIQGMARGAAITLHSKAAVGFLLQQPSIRDVAYLVFQLDAVVVGRNRHSIDDVPHETRGP